MPVFVCIMSFLFVSYELQTNEGFLLSALGCAFYNESSYPSADVLSQSPWSVGI